MSYLSDKEKCQGHCGELFDRDLLNRDGVCRDCVIDDEMVEELRADQQAEDRFAGRDPFNPDDDAGFFE